MTLNNPHDLVKIADEQHKLAKQREAAEEYVCNRLLAWLDDEPRRSADNAFTAGPLRNLARKFEELFNDKGL